DGTGALSGAADERLTPAEIAAGAGGSLDAARPPPRTIRKSPSAATQVRPTASAATTPAFDWPPPPGGAELRTTDVALGIMVERWTLGAYACHAPPMPVVTCVPPRSGNPGGASDLG